MAAYVLGLFRIETGRNYYLIDACGHEFEIILECSGIYTALLYVSCVLSFPADLKRKTAGIALGLPAIFVINIIRLTTLMVIDIRLPLFSDFAHCYVWDVSFIILVVILFQIWVDGIVEKIIDKLLFLVKFLIYSIALFAVIIFVVKTPYQHLLGRVVELFLRNARHFDQNSHFIIANRIYNLVTLTSLILATGRIPWLKKLKIIIIGSIVIFIFHCIISLIANIEVSYHLARFYRVSLEVSTIIMYFSLPLLLWIILAYNYTFKDLRSMTPDSRAAEHTSAHPDSDDG